MNKAPAVMVSSTFFDLRQIRADLTSFLVDQLGFTPLLSELNNFPIDPDADTIENCRRRVENEADILVLVIGGRYGSIQTRSGKSITNIEYLVARAKGIPIYVFIDSSVISLLPIWKDNPSADFSSAVDDPRLFQFIEDIRTNDKVWTFEFRTAEDIISTLRAQFSYLLNQGLVSRLRFKESELPTDPALGAKSLRIALEKPSGWEYRLFAQSLADQIDSLRDFRREYRFGVVFGESQRIDVDEVFTWMKTRLTELRLLLDSANKLVNDAVPVALGPPGKPGNVDAILFTTRKLGSLYREAIEWSHRIQRASLDERLQEAQAQFAKLTSEIVSEFDTLGPRFVELIESALSRPKDGSVTSVNATISLRLPSTDGLVELFKNTIERIIADDLQ
jgi:Domain of unknown function (DUF4062)